MKIIFTLILLFSVVRLEAAGSDLEVARFLKMPSSEVGEYLRGEKVYGIRGALIRCAIAARRMDLIEMCYRSNSTGGLTLETVGEMTDLDYKDQIVLMILKCDDRTFWPQERDVANSGNGYSTYKTEPISGTLQRHFPELVNDRDGLTTYAKRLKVAAELEKQIGPPPPLIGKVPPFRAPQEAPPSPPPISPKTEAPEVAIATQPGFYQKASPWAAGCVGLVLVALLGLTGVRWLRDRRGF